LLANSGAADSNSVHVANFEAPFVTKVARQRKVVRSRSSLRGLRVEEYEPCSDPLTSGVRHQGWPGYRRASDEGGGEYPLLAAAVARYVNPIRTMISRIVDDRGP
jgi:hypothetical protein